MMESSPGSIITTGPPSNVGHPFASKLNPDASEFVPMSPAQTPILSHDSEVNIPAPATSLSIQAECEALSPVLQPNTSEFPYQSPPPFNHSHGSIHNTLPLQTEQYHLEGSVPVLNQELFMTNSQDSGTYSHEGSENQFYIGDYSRDAHQFQGQSFPRGSERYNFNSDNGRGGRPNQFHHRDNHSRYPRANYGQTGQRWHHENVSSRDGENWNFQHPRGNRNYSQNFRKPDNRNRDADHWRGNRGNRYQRTYQGREDYRTDNHYQPKPYYNPQSYHQVQSTHGGETYDFNERIPDSSSSCEEKVGLEGSTSHSEEKTTEEQAFNSTRINVHDSEGRDLTQSSDPPVDDRSFVPDQPSDREHSEQQHNLSEGEIEHDPKSLEKSRIRKISGSPRRLRKESKDFVKINESINDENCGETQSSGEKTQSTARNAYSRREPGKKLTRTTKERTSLDSDCDHTQEQTKRQSHDRIVSDQHRTDFKKSSGPRTHLGPRTNTEKSSQSDRFSKESPSPNSSGEATSTSTESEGLSRRKAANSSQRTDTRRRYTGSRDQGKLPVEDAEIVQKRDRSARESLGEATHLPAKSRGSHSDKRGETHSRPIKKVNDDNLPQSKGGDQTKSQSPDVVRKERALHRGGEKVSRQENRRRDESHSKPISKVKDDDFPESQGSDQTKCQSPDVVEERALDRGGEKVGRQENRRCDESHSIPIKKVKDDDFPESEGGDQTKCQSPDVVEERALDRGGEKIRRQENRRRDESKMQSRNKPKRSPKRNTRSSNEIEECSSEYASLNDQILAQELAEREKKAAIKTRDSRSPKPEGSLKGNKRLTGKQARGHNTLETDVKVNSSDAPAANTEDKALFKRESGGDRRDTTIKKSDGESDPKTCSITETRKLVDPRMERERMNLSDPVTYQSSSTVSNSRGRYSDTNAQDRDRDLLEKEYDYWENHWKEVDEFRIVSEIQGDLFEQPKEFSLAHCVAEDLRMGSGIAVAFKRDFKNLSGLMDQRAKQGGLAVLHDAETNRYVYYLVTKRESTGKPTYHTLWRSLSKMRQHAKENDVKKIAVPRLGCGLDRLEWDKVKSMLETLFKEMEMEIRVCNFQQSELIEERKSKCKLVVEDYPITKIASGTLLIYFAAARGDPDSITTHMSKKIHFLPSFQQRKDRKLGDVIYHDDKVLNFGVCGCIVRQTRKDQLSFASLQKCIQTITKMNRQFEKQNAKFNYVAFQWLNDEEYFDDLINQKVITMFTNLLRDVDVYVCRGEFEQESSGDQ